MSYAAAPGRLDVTTLFSSYEEARHAWVEAEITAPSADGAAIWAALLATRSTGPGEMELKLRLLTELLEEDLPPGHGALALLRSLSADLAVTAISTFPLDPVQTDCHPLAP